ncbi:MAG: hypothetical protein Q9226_008569 [Calogaya cf. arnoldii]
MPITREKHTQRGQRQPYHRGPSLQQLTLSYQQQQQHSTRPLASPQTSNRVEDNYHLSPRDKEEGLHGLLQPVYEWVLRSRAEDSASATGMRAEALALPSVVETPSTPMIPAAASSDHLTAIDPDVDLVSQEGAQFRRETGGQGVSGSGDRDALANSGESSGAATGAVGGNREDQRHQHHRSHSAPSVPMRNVFDDIIEIQESDDDGRVAIVGCATPMDQVYSRMDQIFSEQVRGEAGVKSKAIENSNTPAVRSPDPSAAVSDKGKETENAGSDVLSPQASATRRTLSVETGHSDDCTPEGRQRVLHALRQRTSSGLPPLLKPYFDFGIRQLKEAMEARSPAELPRGLVPIYHDHFEQQGPHIHPSEAMPNFIGQPPAAPQYGRSPACTCPDCAPANAYPNASEADWVSTGTACPSIRTVA